MRAALGKAKGFDLVRALVLLLAGGLVLQACSAGDPLQASRLASQEPPADIAALDRDAALKMVNRYRAAHGLDPVSINGMLNRVAEAHSEDLASGDRAAHEGSDGSDPWKRVERSGYHPRIAAENVGAGQLSLAEVFKGWQDSPSHNDNLLLKGARHMGIALKYAPKTSYKTFWTLVLAAPM